MSVSGEQILKTADKTYTLRLSFAAVKKIETELQKSIIRLDALNITEMVVSLSAVSNVSEVLRLKL